MKIHCGGKMGIGDELTFTALAREHKRAFPLEEIHLFNSSREWIWKNNPHLWHGSTLSGKEIRPNTYGWMKASTAHAYAKALGFHLVDDTPEVWLTQEELSQDFGIENWDKTIAVDLEAMWPSRTWDPTKFIRTVELLRWDGWRIIEVGWRPAKDHPLASIQFPADFSFLTKLQPRQNCALLSKVSLYLGADSGNFHMAAAVNTPQVVIFGPIPWFARAYWNTTPVFAYTDCAASCMERCLRQVPPPHGPIKHCLEEIEPDRVAEAVRVAYNRFVAPGLRISRPRPGRSRPLVPAGDPPVEW